MPDSDYWRAEFETWAAETFQGAAADLQIDAADDAERDDDVRLVVRTDSCDAAITLPTSRVARSAARCGFVAWTDPDARAIIVADRDPLPFPYVDEHTGPIKEAEP